MYYFIDILNFLQALAWPIVAYCVFRHFADPLKSILASMNKAVNERGIKLASPIGGSVEIPGTQKEVGSISEFINKVAPDKYIRSGRGKNQQTVEGPEDTVAQSLHGTAKVLEAHEASLVSDIYQAINTKIQENKDVHSEEDFLLGLLCDAYISLYFERSYQAILGSQLALLKKLHTTVSNSLSEYEVKIHFQSGIQQNKTTYEQWLGFLERARFIEKNKDKIQLTNEGKEFLEYIHIRSYPDEKSG